MCLFVNTKLYLLFCKYNFVFAYLLVQNCIYKILYKPLGAGLPTNTKGTLKPQKEISMQVNCSINHTLNQNATDDELRLLVSLIERDFFQPAQRTVVESFVSRKSIQNYLSDHANQEREGGGYF